VPAPAAPVVISDHVKIAERLMNLTVPVTD
jgi:hypothetical protein